MTPGSSYGMSVKRSVAEVSSIQKPTVQGSTSFVAGGRLDVPGRLMDLTIASGPVAQGAAPVTAQDVLAVRGNWDNPAISLIKPDKPSAKVDLPVRGY